MIVNEYKKYKQEQQVLEMLYGTTDPDKIEKMNNKIKKQSEEITKDLYQLLNK